tara:strand:- start:13 stop:156 length:144 start_codon:yes stop_codon:yes gene_type:complete
MNKEEALRAVIDELKLENRKMEYSSAFERLTRRVVALEERLNKLEKN